MEEEIEREINRHGFVLLDKTIKDKENVFNVSSEEGYRFYIGLRAVEKGKPHPFHQDNPWTIWNIKNIWLLKNAPDYEFLDEKNFNSKYPMKWRNKKLGLDMFERSWSGFKSRPVDPTLSDQGIRKTSEKVLIELNEKVASHKRFRNWKMVDIENFNYEHKNQLIKFKHKDGFLSASKINTIINTDNGLRLFHASIPDYSIYNIKKTLELNRMSYRLVEEQTFTNRE